MRQHAALTAELAAAQASAEEVQGQLDAARAARPASDERDAAVAALAAAKARNSALKEELESRAGDDPAMMERISKLVRRQLLPNASTRRFISSSD